MVDISADTLTTTVNDVPLGAETLNVARLYQKPALTRGRGVVSPAKPAAWSEELAIRFLRDWIISAREAGLQVDVWDARPEATEFRVAVVGYFYCAECGDVVRGEECSSNHASQPRL